MFEDVQPAIAPYEDRAPVCRPYDRRAADVARQVASLIRPHLGRVEFEPVGSTAVPGCDGQGIVDLLLVVPGTDSQRTAALLERLGFQRRSAENRYPASGSTWVGAWTHQDETFLLHLFLMAPDAPEADEMRFFRTCLSVDPELAQAYVARKRAILAGGQIDSRQYDLAKGEFIREVLR